MLCLTAVLDWCLLQERIWLLAGDCLSSGECEKPEPNQLAKAKSIPLSMLMLKHE